MITTEITKGVALTNMCIRCIMLKVRSVAGGADFIYLWDILTHTSLLGECTRHTDKRQSLLIPVE
jgi:hypothetical protein